jgi:hypothetical protein
MDMCDSLEQTFSHAENVIATVREDQHGDKTPCEEWTVRELLEHMIGVVAGLGAAAGGEPPSSATPLGPRWRHGGRPACSTA